MKRNKTWLCVALTAVSTATMVGVFLLGNTFGGGLFQALSEQKTYTLRISADDIANGFARSSGGSDIAFDAEKVSAEEGKIRIAQGGKLSITVPLNGTRSASFVPSASFSGEDKLTLDSGYAYGSYGASEYLTLAKRSADAYYRTYFQFRADEGDVEVDELALTYGCEEHYRFTPVMNTVNQKVDSGKAYTYSGLTYEGDVEPDLNEVDIVRERFTLEIPSSDYEPIYSIHPIAKFYDKGGCLIKQIQGFWVANVNPVLIFHIGKDNVVTKSIDGFTTKNLTTGILSGFDWREYTLSAEEKASYEEYDHLNFFTHDDGILRSNAAISGITSTQHFWPRVTVNVNPGAYSSDASRSLLFWPSPSQVNYGFPDIAEPENVDEHYYFEGYLNGDEYYDPVAIQDFYDCDLYAQYSSDYDLRLKFINRGFDNAYLEVGIREGGSYTMPDEDSYLDQSCLGLELGHRFERESEDSFSMAKGFLVYPLGEREPGKTQFYEVGSTFINTMGSSGDPATYVAEPYTLWNKKSNNYYEIRDISYPVKDGVNKGLNVTSLTKYAEHLNSPGSDDARSYFKQIVIPDSYGVASYPYYAAVYDIASNAINDTVELEEICGNNFLNTINSYGCAFNTALKRIEYFPSLANLADNAFEGCTSLRPMQEWVDVGAIDFIGAYAFKDCYVSPETDAEHNVRRRTFAFPSTVKRLGQCCLYGAVFTDIYVDGEALDPAQFQPHNVYLDKAFMYSDHEGEHSSDFAVALERYQQASEQQKPFLIPLLKAVANHLIFEGSEELYNSLSSAPYDELDSLLNHEFYVTFTK